MHPLETGHHEHAQPDGMLERNLRALGARSRVAAEAIRRAAAHAEVVLEVAPDGGLTGQVRTGGVWRRLASARGPLGEGEALGAGVDLVSHAAVVVMGFGVGHHVSALVRRMKGQGVVLVFEPDAALLRAVFERVDCSAWLSQVVIITQGEDVGALAAATQGIEAVLASGTKILDHPPSRARLGASRDKFAQTLAQVMKAVRTNIVTTLVQVDVTVRNLMHNARAYVESPGVCDLRASQSGRAAVVVSAGPSLRRNVDLLGDERLRSGVVVIAVQTVLRTLLSRGIRPDYVTALDYHEISARFYEGLTAEDVRGVTLVVEPKCNPAILASWPGRVRCVGDDTLDRILGPRIARDKGRLPPGATVAHLAYYLARHLGCDPVILIGQDLGFTDGLYYGPGAAIHNVWAGELNEFNTLEMLEWQRIARMPNMLRRAEDVHGRSIYTDEQMSTYLVQFERDFRRDAERGLTVIDATEGGVRKRHTRVLPLREALRQFGRPGAPSASADAPVNAGVTREGLERRFRELRRSVLTVEERSRRARALLAEMLRHQQDQARVNRLIEDVTRMGEEVAGEDGYWLVQHVNQAGQLNRYKADRAIEVEGLEGMERQKREIERDMRNVEWLGDAAEGVGRMIEEAIVSLRTGRPATRESTPIVRAVTERKRVWACVPVDHEFGALGIARDLSRVFAAGRNPLQLTLARLARCARLEGVVLLCRDVARARDIAGATPPGMRIEFQRWGGSLAPRRAGDGSVRATRIGAARGWARHCWRGGVGNLSVFDEALDAPALRGVMRARAMDAAVVLGADWALVDPALVDAIIERHEERPEGQPMTFTQAPPGLCGCLLSRGLVEELARVPAAAVGGMLGYHPVAPQGDPIAKPACVSVPPGVRDLLVRCVPDTARHAQRLARALAALGERVLEAGAEELAAHLDPLRRDGPVEALEVRVRPAMDRVGLVAAMRDAIEQGDAPAVTIAGEGCDALDVPGVTEIVAAARACGAQAVHLRTRLARPGAAARRVLSLADVVSVDLLAENEETYRMLTGAGGFEAAKRELARLIEANTCWVVPRITRRDEVLGEVEGFYTRWLVACGACVIDPRGDAPEGARAEALPLPARAAERLSWSRAVVRAQSAEVVLS